MRILVVTYEFPPVGGGGGSAAHDICKHLVSRGHEVMVLTAHLRGLPFQETRDGIQLVRIRSLRREPFRATFPAMLGYIISGFWNGLQLIRSFRPEVIHAHFAVPSGALAYVLSFLTGIPYVLTAHLGDVPGGVPEKTDKWFRWVKPLTFPIWKRAGRIIAVSAHTRQLALQSYPLDISIIPNGVDTTLLRPQEIQCNHPPRIVFAGRFVFQKNPVAIVHVLSQLRDLEWHCAMLGDGPLMDVVRKEIELNTLESRFHLPGWVTPEEVLTEFSKSDILFMPSLSEGLPVTGVQALAKGLAFVVSNIGGFVDLVDQRNGFLIDTHDLVGFENALRALLSNPEHLIHSRRMSLQKAHEFDIHGITEKYEVLFRELLSER